MKQSTFSSPKVKWAAHEDMKLKAERTSYYENVPARCINGVADLGDSWGDVVITIGGFFVCK